ILSLSKGEGCRACSLPPIPSPPVLRQAHHEQPLSCSPLCLSGEDCVCEDEEFSGAGDESRFMGFALGYEALIEIDQRLVPPESCRQGSRVEGRAYGIAASGDVASSCQCGGIPVERRKSCQACRLLAREGAKLRHADD